MTQPYFLFVSVDGMTDPLGGSQVLPYLINLSAKGFKIGIVSCEKIENFNSQGAQIKALIEKSDINWNYSFYKTGKPFYSQWLNYRALKKNVSKEISLHSNVVLHCRSYLPALVGFYSKLRTNAGFIFDMRGFWADERIEGNIWSKTNPIEARLYSFFKRKEKQLLLKADAIISLTYKAKNIISGWNIEESKITVIPCCADLNHFSKASCNEGKLNEFKSQFNALENKFVLSYVGSLGTWYMAKEMLDFFKVLSTKIDTVFLLITKDDPEIIYDLASQSGIDKSSLLVVSSNRNDIPYYMNLSQASLFFIKPTFSKSASSPTKMGELLSMQIPVVTNTGIGDVDDIINEMHCGVLINEFNEKSYSVAADDLLKNIDHYKSNALKAANNFFSLEIGVQKYAEVYSKFL